MEIIQRGAEAVLYLDEQEGKKVLVKERIRKSYRIDPLDVKLRSQRTKRENKLMERARGSGLNIPSSVVADKFKLIMDYIEGKKVKDVLNDLPVKDRENICKQMGQTVFKLHDNGIIHGDLTTSNFIIDRKRRVFLIDFGLGRFSHKVEDQAVDLFLLYEALKSTHYKILDSCWETILKNYRKYQRNKEVMARFEQIKKRRRYAGD